MSDISFDGLVSALVGISFVGFAAFLLLPIGGLVLWHVLAKRKPWTPSVLGLVVSMAIFGVCGGGVMVGAEYAGLATDNLIFVWAPAVVFGGVSGGVVAGLFARGMSDRSDLNE